MKVNELKKVVSVIIVLFSVFSFSQSRKIADKYFEEFSYVKAAELYKELYSNHGDDSKHVLTRLADSYYNNVNTEKAELWYKKLIKNYKVDLSEDYLFKYAQVLRSNKKYKKSDSILSLIGGIKNGKFKSEKADYLLELTKGAKKKISISNLSINSRFSDYGGFVVNDTIYYSSSAMSRGKIQKVYGWNNQPFLNIYKAKIKIEFLDENKKKPMIKLLDSKMLEAPVTTKYHEGKPIFTKDGKTMYFTRNSYNGKRISGGKKRTVNLKIFQAKLINGVWSKVIELPFNSNNYSVGQPALSLDEKTLYFTSDMPGGYGKTDIYKVKIYSEGKFGSPENLGDKINTLERETFPFIGKDNLLYFSSDGHLGLGLLDIFQVDINSKPNNNFQVNNLGSPFNSSKDDFAFYLNQKGDFGFFSSNRKKGKGDDDIYGFFIYPEAPCVQEIIGNVTDFKTKKPIDKGTVAIINDKGEVIDEVLTDGNGEYKIPNILCKKKYTIRAHKLDYKPKHKEVEVGLSKIKEKFNFSLIPVVVENQIVINPIYFDLDEYSIREDAKYELENIYTTMTHHPEIVIEIESHTDSRGTSKYNLSLSQKRALATKNYLIKRGISSDRIQSAKGFGESQLLNNCIEGKLKCTEAEHAINRRSYFYIVKGLDAIKERKEREEKELMKRINDRRREIKKLRKEE